jgi:outer membrane autotransporter protein
LNGCAHAALLTAQVIAPLGVTLPSPVQAQVLGLPGATTTGQAIVTSGPFSNSGTITGDADGLILVGSGSITNAGTIIGTSSDGIRMTGGGGTLTNTAGGLIEGGIYGVEMVAGGGTVFNAGTILDDAIAGVALASNATAINTTSGTIGGVTGVVFTGTDASLANSGTITGTGGVAVQFDAGVNDLTLDTGSVLNGSIDGGGGAGQITLAGTGSMANTIANFGTGSALTIASGASWTASSDWTIDTVTNAGTFQAGTLASPLHLSGNYVQTPIGVFQVVTDVNGRSSQLQITGTATLNGGTVSVLAGSGSYQPSTQYTILTSSGLSGRFNSVSSDFAFLTPTLSYDANNAYLGLALTPIRYSSIAETLNQAHTADAIQSGGLGSPLSQAVVGRSADGARQAFDALSGEAYASVDTALLDDSTMISQSILDRLRQATFGQADGAMAALGAGGPTTIDPMADALGYAETELQLSGTAAATERMGTTSTGTRAPTYSSIAVWGEAFGGWGRFDGNGNAAATRNDRGGFIAGVDSAVGDDWRAGLAGGVTSSTLDDDARNSSADIDSYNLALYAGRSFDALNLRFGGAYSWQTVSMNRKVQFPGFDEPVGSDYDARTGQIFGELGYSLNWRDVAFEPFAGFSYVHVDTDAAHEHGGAAALSVRGDSFDVGYSTLGVRLGTVWSLDKNTVLTPHLSLAWQYAAGDVGPGANLAFDTGDAFNVSGTPLARNAALIEAGTNLAIGNNISFGLSYKGTIAEHAQDHQIKGDLAWKF